MSQGHCFRHDSYCQRQIPHKSHNTPAVRASAKFATTAALRDLMETHSYQNCGNYSMITQSNASAQLKTPSETLTAKSRFGKTARVHSDEPEALATHLDITSQNCSARSTPCSCSTTTTPDRCEALSLWRMGEL